MLVLSRKEDERIQIGDDITITVVRIQGDKVRIGIEAPQTVPVVRDELFGDRDTWLTGEEP
jgi:carbon storage regulator